MAVVVIKKMIEVEVEADSVEEAWNKVIDQYEENGDVSDDSYVDGVWEVEQ